MIQVKILPSFQRCVKKLTQHEKMRLANGLHKLNAFIATGETTAGFSFKKINHDKYEFRIDARLRVIIKKETDVYWLVLVGGHSKVSQYLHRFR